MKRAKETKIVLMLVLWTLCVISLSPLIIFAQVVVSGRSGQNVTVQMVGAPPLLPRVSLQAIPTGNNTYSLIGNNRMAGSWVNLQIDGNFVDSSSQARCAWNYRPLPPPLPQQPFMSPAAAIPGLAGSGSGISGADTDLADFGQYGAANGAGASVTHVAQVDGYHGPGIKDGTAIVTITVPAMGLIGGPLLDDLTAASLVQIAPASTVENGPKGPANAMANAYFENVAVANPANYITQLRAFWSAYQGSAWYSEIRRVDGACPLRNPSTAEVAQWAAAKWGLHPYLAYAEATSDGDWDQTALGDGGNSSGVCQVADRNSAQAPYHAFPGFSGAGANLARENTCFNFDFWAAHMYAAFHGLTGECSGKTLDVGGAVQTWADGSATCATGGYTAIIWQSIANRTWEGRFFAGQGLPAPATPSAKANKPLLRRVPPPPSRSIRSAHPPRAVKVQK